MSHDADANHPLGRRVLRSLYEQLLKARHAERWTGTAADGKRGEAVFVGATAGLTARDAVIRVEDDVARLAVACENLPKNAVAVVLLSSESAMVKAAAARMPRPDHNWPAVFVLFKSPQRSSGTHSGVKFKMPRFIVDETDVVAVYRVAQEAIRRARTGGGPTLIECTHCRSSSNGQRRRSARYAEDPLLKLELYLKKQGAWSAGWERSLHEHIRVRAEVK